MEKIKQSYFNLLMIASNVRSNWVSKVAVESFLLSIELEDCYPENYIEETKKHFESQCYPIKGYLSIQTCAFLDEYKTIFKLMPDDSKLNDEAKEFKDGLKKILKPAIALIENSWKDIYSTRNILHAHNWRKNGKLIMFSDLTKDVPNTPWIDEEFTLLVGIFNAIIPNLKEYRKDFYDEMYALIAGKTKVKVHHMSRVTTHDESVELINALEAVMDYELQLELEKRKKST